MDHNGGGVPIVNWFNDRGQMVYCGRILLKLGSFYSSERGDFSGGGVVNLMTSTAAAIPLQI